MVKLVYASFALAVVALAGCSTGTPGSGGTESGAAAASSSGTCAQQFKAWQNGPVKAVATQIGPELQKVQAAANTEDIPQLNAGLKAVGGIAGQLEAYPMPACADPAGYWGKFLGYLKAAGDNAGSSAGLAGLLTALAPLRKLPGVEASLSAELAKNAGVHGKVVGS